jgi:hypothetical protein
MGQQPNGRERQWAFGAGEMAGKGRFLPLSASQKASSVENEKSVLLSLVPHEGNWLIHVSCGTNSTAMNLFRIKNKKKY